MYYRNRLLVMTGFRKLYMRNMMEGDKVFAMCPSRDVKSLASVHRRALMHGTQKVNAWDMGFIQTNDGGAKPVQLFSDRNQLDNEVVPLGRQDVPEGYVTVLAVYKMNVGFALDTISFLVAEEQVVTEFETMLGEVYEGGDDHGHDHEHADSEQDFPTFMHTLDVGAAQEDGSIKYTVPAEGPVRGSLDITMHASGPYLCTVVDTASRTALVYLYSSLLTHYHGYCMHVLKNKQELHHASDYGP